MSDQEAEIVPPSTVLKKLSKETLKRLYTRESNEDSQEEQKEVSPKKMRQIIAKIIDEEGLDCTLKELKRDDLKALSEALKITFEKDDNKNSKPVIIKKIKEALKTTTINDFLEKEADKKLLKTLCSSMDVDTDSKDTNQEMAKQICDKIQENGASMYWTSCDIDLLHAATSDLKMKTAKNTNSKRKLVDALLTDSAPEKESPRKKKKKKSEPISEDKPAIQKGVDYDNIFQHYNCTELKEYCKNKGMKGNGNKKQLIERILQYLEGDDEEEEEQEKKKPSKDTKKKNDSD